TGASKQGLVTNDESQRIINAGTINPGASGYKSESALASYFSRAFYSYKNRYLFTANFRRDGSSNFGDGQKWGNFPSFSAGWVFSDEDFMENLTWLTTGKLRASWGQIGNQAIGGGAYRSEERRVGKECRDRRLGGQEVRESVLARRRSMM